MSALPDGRLQQRLTDHDASVREYLDRARALNDVEWLTPRADGKWTPAQETRHVILFYEAFLRDLAGGPSVTLKGTPWRRVLWKAIGLGSIIWRKRIPVAVRSPREARPGVETTAAPLLLEELRARALTFERTFAATWTEEPGRRVMHPFFGAITLDHAIQVATVHTRHHAAFLPEKRGG